MYSFAAVVVTFHPERAAIDNLKRLATMVPQLIIVDNTPTNKAAHPLNRSKIKARILFNQSNPGQARALNQGMHEAVRLGFDHVFLFDQDSYPPPEYCSAMMRFKHRIDTITDRCALYVPNFFDRNCRRPARFPVIRPFRFHHTECTSRVNGNTFVGVILAITSGTLIAASRFRQLGPFRQEYFIDFVDTEYCLRAGRHRLVVAVNCRQTMDHAIGRRRTRRLLGMEIRPNNHSALRRYYMSRNGVYTALRYFPWFPSCAWLVVLRLTHEMLSIVCFETEKKTKMTAMIWGVAHALLNVMGKCAIRSLADPYGSAQK